MSDQFDFVFKFLLVGDSRVGKSSLLCRFVDNVFTGNTITTIGADYKIKTVYIDGKSVKLHIWDTAGEERFKAITSCYYRGAQAFLVVYDITNQGTFDNLKHWLKEIERNTTNRNSKIILIGNKSDLDGQRKVEFSKAKEYADKLGIELIETSAKDCINVENGFIKMSSDLVSEISSKVKSDTINLNATPQTVSTGYCCSYF